MLIIIKLFIYRVPNYWNDNDYDDDPNNNYNDHDHNNNSRNIQLQYSALHEIHCIDLYMLKGMSVKAHCYYSVMKAMVISRDSEWYQFVSFVSRQNGKINSIPITFFRKDNSL